MWKSYIELFGQHDISKLVIVHIFQNHGTRPWNIEKKRELLIKNPRMVINLNWRGNFELKGCFINNSSFYLISRWDPYMSPICQIVLLSRCSCSWYCFNLHIYNKCVTDLVMCIYTHTHTHTHTHIYIYIYILTYIFVYTCMCELECVYLPL